MYNGIYEIRQSDGIRFTIDVPAYAPPLFTGTAEATYTSFMGTTKLTARIDGYFDKDKEHVGFVIDWTNASSEDTWGAFMWPGPKVPRYSAWVSRIPNQVVTPPQYLNAPKRAFVGHVVDQLDYNHQRTWYAAAPHFVDKDEEHG